MCDKRTISFHKIQGRCQTGHITKPITAEVRKASLEPRGSKLAQLSYLIHTSSLLVLKIYTSLRLGNSIFWTTKHTPPQKYYIKFSSILQPEDATI
jgi:hypothetical protein